MISWQPAATSRLLTIVDISSRFSPALEPRLTFRGTDVVGVLERVCNEVGFPATIRVDQGSSSCRTILTSGPTNTALGWTSRAPESRPTTPSSKPSTDASRLNAHWVLSLADAREKSGDLA